MTDIGTRALQRAEAVLHQQREEMKALREEIERLKGEVQGLLEKQRKCAGKE